MNTAVKLTWWRARPSRLRVGRRGGLCWWRRRPARHPRRRVPRAWARGRRSSRWPCRGCWQSRTGRIPGSCEDGDEFEKKPWNVQQNMCHFSFGTVSMDSSTGWPWWFGTYSQFWASMVVTLALNRVLVHGHPVLILLTATSPDSLVMISVIKYHL